MKYLARDHSHDPTEPATIYVHIRSRVGHGAERHQEIGYGHVSNETIGDGSHVRLCQHDEDRHDVSVERQEEHQAVHQEDNDLVCGRRWGQRVQLRSSIRGISKEKYINVCYEVKKVRSFRYLLIFSKYSLCV